MYISRIHILVDLVDPLCITLLIDTYSYTCSHICVGGYVDLRLSLIWNLFYCLWPEVFAFKTSTNWYQILILGESIRSSSKSSCFFTWFSYPEISTFNEYSYSYIFLLFFFFASMKFQKILIFFNVYSL